MKKLLLFIVCLFILPICVSAEEYTISELEIKVDISSNYLVITRDNYKNNPGMEALGVTPEYMEQVFENYNVYLDAFDSVTGHEIFIIVNPVNGDYSEYSVEELEELIPTLESYYASLNGENIKTEVVNVNGVNYFKIDYAQGGYYLINYYLVSNNNGYNFQIQSKTPLTESEKASFHKIIESISFGYDEEVPPVAEDNDASSKDNLEDKKESEDQNGKLFTIIGASIGALVGTIISIICLSKKKNKNNKCSNCGNELNKDIKFCPNCGANIKKEG